MKAFWRYWGYFLLAVLVMTWGWIRLGPLAIAGLTLVTTGYFLFQAPVWCGAVNRDGTLCRRNASGLLCGCSLRHHKWQKVRLAFANHAGYRISKALFPNVTTGLATVGTVGTLIIGATGVIVSAVK